ncbi:MAG: iron-containing alcohol dehydrogenase [Deltaproteobacteria bacterium]|nr:iron-containing alcohol dehydrogenase [Deltaproteobacteria bacterium]
MNFELILPQKVIFGEGSIKKVGEEAKSLGIDRVLIVTSRGMLKREFLTQITGYLLEHQLSFDIFSRVKPEPPIENVYDCIAFAKDNSCNLLIGLGGGSVIDIAKKVAADLGLPKIMVPTTAGTGSEVTHESVFKVEGKKRAFVDKNLVPNVAIVDPDLTKTMPPLLTASSGIDALAHALECYESRKSNPLVKTIALDAFKLLKENIEKAVQGNRRARINMSLGSLMAGMAFGNSGTTLAHALSYPLSNRGVPHSQSVALVLPFALEFNGSDPRLVEKLKGLRKLVHCDWNADWDANKMAEEVMCDERHLANNPSNVTYRDLLEIFERMKRWLLHEGDL